MHRLLLTAAFLALLCATSAGQGRQPKPEPAFQDMPLTEFVRANSEYNKLTYVWQPEFETQTVHFCVGAKGATLNADTVHSMTAQILDAQGFTISRSPTFHWVDKRTSLPREVVPVDAEGLANAGLHDLVWYSMPTRYRSILRGLHQARTRVWTVALPGGVALMGNAVDVRAAVALEEKLNAEAERTELFELPPQIDSAVAESIVAEMATRDVFAAHGKLIARGTPKQLAALRQVLEALEK